MSRTLFVVALCALASGNLASAALTTGCSNFNAIKENTVHLEPYRYDGTWYEQVRTVHSPFEDNCFCSQANYTLADDGSVVVDNTCRKGSAASPISGAVGKAVIPDSTHPGYLLVSFGIQA